MLAILKKFRLFDFFLTLQFFSLILVFALSRYDGELGATGKSNLSIPRFVSLNSEKVYMRLGPGRQYPINWVYHRLSLPMMVIAEYQRWRKVRDHDGIEGWIHRTLLTNKRHVIVVGEEHSLKAGEIDSSEVIARVEGGVIAGLESCGLKKCLVRIRDYRGWLNRRAVFGLLSEEKIR